MGVRLGCVNEIGRAVQYWVVFVDLIPCLDGEGRVDLMNLHSSYSLGHMDNMVQFREQKRWIGLYLAFHTSKRTPSNPRPQHGILIPFIPARVLHGMQCEQIFLMRSLYRLAANTADAKQRPTTSIYALCAVLESIVTVIMSANLAV
jgi:hypothetical protein